MYQAVWNHGGVPLAVRWRSLTWREHREVTRRGDPARLQHAAAYRLCVLDGPALYDAPAGIVEWIGRQQIERSLFTEDFRRLSRSLALERSRFASSACEGAKAVIAWAFRYSFEEIDGWTAETFLERWVQAEYILGVKLEPQDPNAPQPEARKAAPQRPRGLGDRRSSPPLPPSDAENFTFSR